jgi:hypothetical protein
MSKRNRKPAPSTGRAAAVQVKKPFPWGTVAVTAVVALLLGGILFYAVTNQGSGVRDLLAEDDASFAGLVVEADLDRRHTEARVDYEDYPARPPMGGEHNGVPQQCQVYEEEIAPEHAVHSLEHGAVWVTYSPDLPEDQVDALRDEVEGDPYRLLSPLPGQESPVVLTAWGRQLAVDSAEDDRVGRFLDVYTNGRQTLERGALCAGTTATGRDSLLPASPGATGSMAPAPTDAPVDPATEQAPTPPATEPAAEPTS